MEIPYEKADVVDAESTEPDELRKALHAGVIPEAYKDVISDIEIVDRRKTRFSDGLLHHPKHITGNQRYNSRYPHAYNRLKIGKVSPHNIKPVYNKRNDNNTCC